MKAPIKTVAILTIALVVSGCDVGAQLAVAGAVAVFGLGAAAISEGTKDREHYCQEGSGQLYTRYGDCASGDRAMSSAEYQQAYKQKADEDTRTKIAANDAVRSAKTYCLSSISNTPYIAASGQCQPSDQGISESEYRSAKEEQVKNLSAPPATPADDQSKPTVVAAVSPPSVVPSETIQSAPSAEASSQAAQAIVTPAALIETALPVIPASAKPVASGTAFFVASHGELLTNHHVIEGCRWIGVISGGAIHPAIPVADSESLDLAVIRSDLENDTVATFAKQSPDIGDDNFVAGYPLLDKLWSLNFTNGIVSAVSPLGDQELLQTTAAVQHGNSGGPMFDASGHVVGIIVAKLKDEQAENVNFAIKAGIATAFLNDAGVPPHVSGRGADQKASAIARTAKALVLPAVCFQ
jgi:S1-C subfamily serine protease